MNEQEKLQTGPSNDFAAEADAASPGIVREVFDLLRYNKKWWLLPIVFALFAAGLLILLGGTAFAPFIYPLF
jgi:hypothetical protein